jgi:DNA polymerase III subunit beta
MKATVERAALLKALAHVQSVVERRNTIPILSNVLIEAGSEGLTLSATDLDLSIVEPVISQVSLAGATTVPAHTLFDIVRKLPDGAQIDLTAADGRMTLTAGRSRFQLGTLPRDDFPVIDTGALPFGFTVPTATLKHMIDKTRFAISTEETRYYLGGIFLHVTDEAKPMLRAVATDGHRLARVAIERPDGAVGMPDVIIPRKAVGEVRKLLEEADGDVVVAISPARIRFAVSGIVLTTKLIDGTFPDYSRVIPTGNDKVLTIEPKALAQSVDRVATIATDKTRAVKFAIDPGRITLSVNSPENGTAAEEISVDYDAEALEVGFNSRYLLDILAQLDGVTAQFVMADSGAPVLIQDRAGAPALYVLMPMRV